MKNVVGFTGLKYSGKDTAAAVLIEAGYEHIKMADCLKLMLRTMMEYQGYGPEMITEMLDGSCKEIPTRGFLGKTPRHAMQTIGTDWARKMIHEDIWVASVAARINHSGRPTVISDIRFPNELDMVHALGGEVFRVERPMTATAVADLHPSEAGILRLAVDGVLHNRFGSAAAFQDHVKHTLF